MTCGDLRHENVAKQLMETTLETFHRLDTLVNAAGILLTGFIYSFVISALQYNTNSSKFCIDLCGILYIDVMSLLNQPFPPNVRLINHRQYSNCQPGLVFQKWTHLKPYFINQLSPVTSAVTMNESSQVTLVKKRAWDMQGEAKLDEFF